MCDCVLFDNIFRNSNLVTLVALLSHAGSSFSFFGWYIITFHYHRYETVFQAVPYVWCNNPAELGNNAGCILRVFKAYAMILLSSPQLNYLSIFAQMRKAVLIAGPFIYPNLSPSTHVDYGFWASLLGRGFITQMNYVNLPSPIRKLSHSNSESTCNHIWNLLIIKFIQIKYYGQTGIIVSTNPLFPHVIPKPIMKLRVSRISNMEDI